jgi:hypothetical protein
MDDEDSDDTLIHVHRRHLAEMRDAGREVPLQRGAGPQVSSISLAGWLVADLTSPSQAAIRDETARMIEDVLVRRPSLILGLCATGSARVLALAEPVAPQHLVLTTH